MNEFFTMTNKQLAAYCATNSIDVDSKNVSKPTKTEYLKSIESAGHMVEEDEILNEGLEDVEDLGDVDEFLDISDDTPSMPTRGPVKVSRAERRLSLHNELMPLRRVIITENDKNQTGLQNQVHFATWGNRLIGHHTDKFICGSAWHVREGALNNLIGMMANISIQDEEGNTIKHDRVPKFVIQRLDPLTQEERETIAKRQLIRDSSIESLI